MMQPNVIFIFPDQLRAQALGYKGDLNVITPNLDRLANEGLNFENAISTCPVCSPARASLLTGQYPLKHGVFLNDVYLENKGESIADAYSKAGYDTAYIGKWHVDGHESRSIFIPKERRQGFDYWKVLECTHDYNHSKYYGKEPDLKIWKGYDTIAQSKDAINYIDNHSDEKPFFLMLSFGTPHNPYQTAPKKYRKMYDHRKIKLRENIPRSMRKRARKDLAGYYSHITAIDDCIGEIREIIKKKGIEDNTLLVFWSDHGDMHYSHGKIRKQKPWEESIQVPLIMHSPSLFGTAGHKISLPISPADLMPTLLGYCNIEIPVSVQGTDFSKKINSIKENPDVDQENSVLIASYWPFGEWERKKGGLEYRGIRTSRYTYVHTLKGPWLLYDNKMDPYQLKNLCNKPNYAELQERLNQKLQDILNKQGDKFLPGEEYIKKWGYQVNENGTMPYKK